MQLVGLLGSRTVPLGQVICGVLGTLTLVPPTVIPLWAPADPPPPSRRATTADPSAMISASFSLIPGD